MVAVTLTANQFNKDGPLGKGDDAACSERTSVGTASASTAAHDASSSQTSCSAGGAQCEHAPDARPATLPEKARRKVSFGGTEDIEVQAREVPAHDTPINAVAVKVFCVHCGNQVPPEILTAGTSFCTYCGQRHPENLISWAKTGQACAASAVKAPYVPEAPYAADGWMPQAPWGQHQHWHTMAPQVSGQTEG